MTINDGQRKKIVLSLLFFYSLALSQSALQSEELLDAGECNRPDTALWYPELLETGDATAQGPASLPGISSAIPAFWPMSTYFLSVVPEDF